MKCGGWVTGVAIKKFWKSVSFKLFTEFKSIKNMYNDYDYKEVARASRIGLRPSGLREKEVLKIMTRKKAITLGISRGTRIYNSNN